MILGLFHRTGLRGPAPCERSVFGAVFFLFCGALEELLQLRLFSKDLYFYGALRFFSAFTTGAAGASTARARNRRSRGFFDDLPPPLSPRPLQPSVRRVSQPRIFHASFPRAPPSAAAASFSFFSAPGAPRLRLLIFLLSLFFFNRRAGAA